MAGTFTATSHQGETIDAVVWRVLGAGAVAVGTVLTLNRKLASLGPVLPEGTVVTLPFPAATPVKSLETVQLWD